MPGPKPKRIPNNKTPCRDCGETKEIYSYIKVPRPRYRCGKCGAVFVATPAQRPAKEQTPDIAAIYRAVGKS